MFCYRYSSTYRNGGDFSNLTKFELLVDDKRFVIINGPIKNMNRAKKTVRNFPITFDQTVRPGDVYLIERRSNVRNRPLLTLATDIASPEETEI